MRTKRIKHFLVAFFVGFALYVFITECQSARTTADDSRMSAAVDRQAQDKPAAQEKLAEEAYKNIQIFKGVPAARLMGAMGFFARSLGVDCTHCHVGDAFDKDDKTAKQTARKMYAMVQLAQKASGSNRVSCFMCHRGHAQPDLPPENWKTEAEALAKDADSDKRPAEQVYKNIQTLKGIPAGRWMLIMTMFSKSLGVDCNYCHVPDAFEKDDKPAKQTARRMLRMVGSIAREIYNGPSSINCYTCHKGQTQPVAFPPANPNPGPAESKPPELITAGPLPTAAEVLDHYQRAIGGPTAFAKLKSRVMKGVFLQGERSVPLEVYEKAPNRMLMVLQIPGNINLVGTDGAVAWQKNQQVGVQEMRGGEAEFTRRLAVFNKEANLPAQYTKLAVKGRAKLGEREAVVIEASPPAGNPERLFFDLQTGLLVRQDFKPEGAPEGMSIQFEDYREIDGVRLPFIRKWMRASSTVTQKFDEIKHNVAVDDAKFNKPASQ